MNSKRESLRNIFDKIMPRLGSTVLAFSAYSCGFEYRPKAQDPLMAANVAPLRLYYTYKERLIISLSNLLFMFYLSSKDTHGTKLLSEMRFRMRF